MISFPVGEQYRGIYAYGVETRPWVRTLYVSGQVVAGLVSPDWLVEVEVVACAE